MSRLPWAIAVVLLTASGASAASDRLPTLRTGTPYSQARASLLHSGYKPIPSDRPVDRCSSVGKMSVGPILRRTRAPDGTWLVLVRVEDFGGPEIVGEHDRGNPSGGEPSARRALVRRFRADRFPE